MRPFVTYVHALWDETRSIEIKFFHVHTYFVDFEKDQLFLKQIHKPLFNSFSLKSIKLLKNQPNRTNH